MQISIRKRQKMYTYEVSPDREAFPVLTNDRKEKNLILSSHTKLDTLRGWRGLCDYYDRLSNFVLMDKDGTIPDCIALEVKKADYENGSGLISSYSLTISPSTGLPSISPLHDFEFEKREGSFTWFRLDGGLWERGFGPPLLSDEFGAMLAVCDIIKGTYESYY